MGCDIHTHVEVKKHIRSKEMWACADFFKLNEYYDSNDEGCGKKYETVEVCGDRDYSRFAVLANVRNYGGTEPIAEPRGIPEDCCKEIKKEYEYWGCDAHSASYFTLEELREWQKTASGLKHSGFISPEDSKLLDGGTIPECWCQGTSDKTWVWREWEEENTVLQPLIDKLIERGSELYFWHTEEQINERAGKMRFVFWFDN